MRSFPQFDLCTPGGFKLSVLGSTREFGDLWSLRARQTTLGSGDSRPENRGAIYFSTQPQVIRKGELKRRLCPYPLSQEELLHQLLLPPTDEIFSIEMYCISFNSMPLRLDYHNGKPNQEALGGLATLGFPLLSYLLWRKKMHFSP